MNVEVIPTLSDPQKYKCQIEWYALGHSTLCLHIYYKKEESMYFHFNDVKYFCGPFRWQGANFRLASEDELNTFRRDVAMLDNMPDDIMSQFHLYMIDEPRLKVRIIAATVTRLDSSMNGDL